MRITDMRALPDSGMHYRGSGDIARDGRPVARTTRQVACSLARAMVVMMTVLTTGTRGLPASQALLRSHCVHVMRSNSGVLIGYSSESSPCGRKAGIPRCSPIMPKAPHCETARKYQGSEKVRCCQVSTGIACHLRADSLTTAGADLSSAVASNICAHSGRR